MFLRNSEGVGKIPAILKLSANASDCSFHIPVAMRRYYFIRKCMIPKSCGCSAGIIFFTGPYHLLKHSF